jgi:hypothetical protein
MSKDRNYAMTMKTTLHPGDIIRDLYVKPLGLPVTQEGLKT